MLGRFNEEVIDSAFKKIVDDKTEDLETHFVYTGHPFVEDNLKSIILKGMKKYKFKMVMATRISLRRRKVITKERMENYCKGKYYEKQSVNDDLESLLHDLQLGSKPDELVGTYFLPKLTTEELKLVDNCSVHNEFWNTFLNGVLADVNKDEMNASESKSKFVYAWGERSTFTIQNSFP